MLIVAHAAAGIAAFALGAFALRARKRRGRHTRAGDAYFWVMVPLLVSGIAIGAGDPAISPFEIAVIPTGGPLLLGYWAGKRRPRKFLGQSWLTLHIAGMGGSFIGVVTAGAFQSVYPLLPDHALTMTATFALPALVGTALIVRATNKRAQPRSPGITSVARRSNSAVRATSGGQDRMNSRVPAAAKRSPVRCSRSRASTPGVHSSRGP